MMLFALYALGILVAVADCLVAAPMNKRKTVIPPPISVTPAENWEGIDGDWNTFAIRVGNPAEVVRVLVSTTSQVAWVIDPKACIYALDKNACAESRGGLFYSNKSSTWQEEGLFDLYIEHNLNLTGNGMFGYDTVALGYVGQGGPSLQHQIVGSIAIEDFYFGHFGLHPKTTNFTDLSDNVPSFMSTLRTQNLIPSVSWGYTQGAPYRFSKVSASLTLGGYDRNRFLPSSVSFPLAPDTDRDLLVNINGISTDLKSNSTRHDVVDQGGSLLESPIYAFIDSTVAELWLPQSACKRFEKAFNLDWDHQSQLYLVNDALHTQLLAANPNVTFTLSPAPSGGPSVHITLPYAAFDLTAKAPYRGLRSSSRYFPLRRAINDTQYTLGRTFLQEAYLTVDWERQNFSVSPINWLPNSPQHLVPIFSPKTPVADTTNQTQTQGHVSMPKATIAGIAVSTTGVISIIAILSFLLYRSNRHRKAKEVEAKAIASKVEDSDRKDESPRNTVVPKVELDASEDVATKIFGKDLMPEPPIAPVEAPENVIYELPGDDPPGNEAGGRELTEKEAMRIREERYNGVDPNPTTPTTGSNGPPNGNSPISPMTPGTNATARTEDSTIISPISASGTHRTISDALAGRPKKMVKGSDITPVKDMEGNNVPLLKRAESEKLEKSNGESARKRFSWEE